MFVKREAIVFYFEQRARIASWKMIARHPRGSGTGVSWRGRVWSSAGIHHFVARGGDVSALRRSSSIRAGTGERGSPGKRTCENFLVFRPARVLSNRFLKNIPRAYTPVIATLPIFNIRTRFCNSSRNRCILSFPLRPSYPVGAGRGYSRRETESSSGRTFSGVFACENCFHFVGKSRPCGAKTNNDCS